MAKPPLRADDDYQKPTQISRIDPKGRSYYVAVWPAPGERPMGIITRQRNVLKAIFNALTRFGKRSRVKEIEVVKAKK